jgi:hypothetical protein
MDDIKELDDSAGSASERPEPPPAPPRREVGPESEVRGGPEAPEKVP